MAIEWAIQAGIIGVDEWVDAATMFQLCTACTMAAEDRYILLSIGSTAPGHNERWAHTYEEEVNDG